MGDGLPRKGDMVRIPAGCRVHRVSPVGGKGWPRAWAAQRPFLVTVTSLRVKHPPLRGSLCSPSVRYRWRPLAAGHWVVYWRNKKGGSFLASVDAVQMLGALELLALAGGAL
jgi:hypothetical protein